MRTDLEAKKMTMTKTWNVIFTRWPDPCREGRYLTLLGLWLVSIMAVLYGCNSYVKGRLFPDLTFQEGSGTILFFYMENLEYYVPKTGFFGEQQKIEHLINRLKIDLNLLQEEIPDLRVVSLDVSVKRDWVVKHQIYEVPTVILFDRIGYEIRRWIPEDYERGGGTVREMKKVIEKMNIVKGKNEGSF